MQRTPQIQQVTPQQQHARATAYQQQAQIAGQGHQAQGRPYYQQPGQIQGYSNDQMHMINSFQQLLFRGTQAQPKAKAENQMKSDKKRLPSVHISNLPSHFYDLDLFKLIKTKKFNVVKAVVVRDKTSSKSLNYGYAQFSKQEDATACQKALNNLEVEGKLTIWSLVVLDKKPDPKANIIVKNIAQTWTQKQVYDHFEKFGPILKCKLECFADDRSRGFAYVQFENEQDAQEAVKQTNGVELGGKKVEVLIHKRADQNKDQKQSQSNNNIYVQGLLKGTSEAQLQELFSEFGEILSSTVCKADSDDTISNTGFVCFKDASSANQAVEKLNKHKLSEGNYLLVSYHVPKRQNDLTKDQTKTTITQNINKNFQSNLFVKKIPAEVTESEIIKVFKPYGEIISVKIKTKGETSRFNNAYVLFEKVESCQNAIRNLDQTRPFGNTPIDVEYWISKVDLAAEKEQNCKDQLEKLVKQTVYDFRQQISGGKNNKANRGNKRGNQNGKGGKPATSTDRKTSKSKERRPQSQPKGTAQKPATPATQWVQVPLPSAEHVKLIANCTTLEQKKQQIGNLIYPCIRTVHGDQYCGKITGMLLDEKVVDLDKLVTNQAYLSEYVGQAKALLESQAQVHIENQTAK